MRRNYKPAGRAALIIAVVWSFCPATPVQAEEPNGIGSFLSELPLDVHGFYEVRSGYRLRNDPHEKDMSVMENRLQLDVSSYVEWADFKVKGDVIGDLVTEEGNFDLREAYLFTMPVDFADLKVGRQILTWGTGDLIFINDLFPKDWQSFFVGRDVEYLKAPSDAAKLSVFNDLANLDIVYVPQFDPDRFITGQRVSYWNSNLNGLAGANAVQDADRPDSWFENSEVAARLYKSINNYEFALYGYHGYWKSPGGQNAAGTQAIFPGLNVYGASVLGAVGKGIGNVEFGYYESKDDQGGSNGLINNSEVRFLVGYEQEIGKNFTAAMQYYLEHMLDYGQYKNSTPVGLARDRNRHLVTLRLTRLLMKQNLTCSLFSCYSPSDEDVYLRPNLHYKASDSLALEVGSNIFFGDHPNTFFGQFQNNTNIYAAVRYSF